MHEQLLLVMGEAWISGNHRLFADFWATFWVELGRLHQKLSRTPKDVVIHLWVPQQHP